MSRWQECSGRKHKVAIAAIRTFLSNMFGRIVDCESQRKMRKIIPMMTHGTGARCLVLPAKDLRQAHNRTDAYEASSNYASKSGDGNFCLLFSKLKLRLLSSVSLENLRLCDCCVYEACPASFENFQSARHSSGPCSPDSLQKQPSLAAGILLAIWSPMFWAAPSVAGSGQLLLGLVDRERGRKDTGELKVSWTDTACWVQPRPLSFSIVLGCSSLISSPCPWPS